MYAVGVEGGGGAYSFVACLGRSTIDHGSLSRQSNGVTGEGLGSLDVGGSTLRRGRTWKSIAGSRIGGTYLDSQQGFIVH